MFHVSPPEHCLHINDGLEVACECMRMTKRITHVGIASSYRGTRDTNNAIPVVTEQTFRMQRAIQGGPIVMICGNTFVVTHWTQEIPVLHTNPHIYMCLCILTPCTFHNFFFLGLCRNYFDFREHLMNFSPQNRKHAGMVDLSVVMWYDECVCSYLTFILKPKCLHKTICYFISQLSVTHANTKTNGNGQNK